MKEQFRGYYPYTADELDSIWAAGIIVLDTNVLLGLYEQSPATRGTFVDALTAVADRLWLPHQVGVEFHRNRENTRRSATSEHNQVSIALSTAIEQARRSTKVLSDRDIHLKSAQAFDRLDRAAKALKDSLGRSKERFNDERKLGGDPVLDVVELLYSADRIGKPFTRKQLTKHRRLGAERFASLQPPGFEDAKGKSGDTIFGDYYLWVQTIKHARQAGRPTILVSDDRKIDWVQGGEPLPALVSEFYDRSGQLVLILGSKQFLKEVSVRVTQADEADVERAADELDEVVANRELQQLAYQSDLASLQEASMGPAGLGFSSDLMSKYIRVANPLAGLNLPKFSPYSAIAANWTPYSGIGAGWTTGLVAALNTQFSTGIGNYTLPEPGALAKARLALAQEMAAQAAASVKSDRDAIEAEESSGPPEGGIDDSPLGTDDTAGRGG